MVGVQNSRNQCHIFLETFEDQLKNRIIFYLYLSILSTYNQVAKPISTPCPVKSSFLLLCPVLSRFYPRVQRSNKKNTRKERAMNSLNMASIGHVRYINIQAWLRGFRVKIAIFFKFLLSLNSQKRLEHKVNNTKYRR